MYLTKQFDLTDDKLNLIIQMLEEQRNERASGNSGNGLRVYDNKALMKLLGVDSRYLKTLRDNGLIAYSRHGDKFWYLLSDVLDFFQNCRFEAYNQKGGQV